MARGFGFLMDDRRALNNSSEVLEVMQKTTLEITRFIDAVCSRYDLHYSLIFGSLIGAVRHQGFIPWDDDLDVLMPRNDYERFIDIVGNMLPDYYELQNFRKTGSKRYVTRIADTRTKIRVESYSDAFNELSVWVDIFPLDGIPDNIILRRIHYLRVYWHKAMCAFASFDETVNKHRPGRPLYQQAIINFCEMTHFGQRLSIQKRLKEYDKALKRYPYDYGEYSFCGVGTYNPERQTWPRGAFESYKRYPFEQTTLCGVEDYDSVLAITYGDYMTIPPEDQRAMHQIELVQVSTASSEIDGD